MQQMIVDFDGRFSRFVQWTVAEPKVQASLAALVVEVLLLGRLLEVALAVWFLYLMSPLNGASASAVAVEFGC